MKRSAYAALIAAGLLLFLPAMSFAAGGQEGAASDETMTITWMAQYEESWVYGIVEEMFNVDIVPNGIYVNDSERVSVMLAAGEFPDAGPLWDGSVELYEDGVIRPIPKDMIRENAPDIAKLYDRFQNGWVANSNPDNRDELLAINGIAANTDYNIFMPMFRADWTLNVGVDLPGYEEKKIPLDSEDRVYFYDQDFTIEWYEDLLRRYRDGDPDGNGRNDTIPYGANNNLWRSFHALSGSFGVRWNDNRYVNGELVYMHNDPGMRDLIRMLSRWYEDGLIDSEFPSQDLNKGWDKIDAGIVASTAEVMTYSGNPALNNRPPNAFIDDDELGQPGAETVVVPPFIGPNGDQGAKAYRPIVPSGGYRFFINRNASDAKTARILQIINYTRATEEGFVYSQYGKPGVHFDWEGEAWASKPIARDAADVPDGYIKQGAWSVYPPFYTPERLNMVYAKDLAAFAQSWLTQERGQSLSTRPARIDMLNETDLPDINRRYGETMTTLFEEFFFKAVTGEIDVDAEWDAYVEQWMENGGEEFLAELEKAPLVEGLREGEIRY